MRFFTYSASVIALAASALVSQARPVRRASATDLLVLKFADVLENLESQFYTQAITIFQEIDFITAGFINAQIPVEQIALIQVDEATHATIIETEIITLGDSPIAGCQFDFSSVLTDVKTMAATARVVENLGVSAYLGAAHLLDDPILLTAAASILTVEARHQSILNVLSGTGTSIPQAFDIALTPQEVLATAAPFISGCDVGITANPTLKVTNTEAVLPGTLLQFSSDAISGDTSNLSCQMLTGGAAVSLTFAMSQCVVPAGINGPVAVYITNDTQPLLGDVTNRASVNVVAGPAIAFIDTQPQMIGQLAKAGSGLSSTQTATISPQQAMSIISSASSAGGSVATSAAATTAAMSSASAAATTASESNTTTSISPAQATSVISSVSAAETASAPM